MQEYMVHTCISDVYDNLWLGLDLRDEDVKRPSLHQELRFRHLPARKKSKWDETLPISVEWDAFEPIVSVQALGS